MRQGDCLVTFIMPVQALASTTSNAAVNFASRSRMRNLNSSARSPKSIRRLRPAGTPLPRRMGRAPGQVTRSTAVTRLSAPTGSVLARMFRYHPARPGARRHQPSRPPPPMTRRFPPEVTANRTRARLRPCDVHAGSGPGPAASSRDAHSIRRDGRSLLTSARCQRAPLAQLAEQRTLNPRVRGSSPWRRTRRSSHFTSVDVHIWH